MSLVLIAVAAVFLAYTNGANDNVKGVASLFGSRAASYGTAIRWATVTTLAGSVYSIYVAQSLVAKFSGRGIAAGQVVESPLFLAAVAFAAGATVLIATLAGFPISTTHALTGAILGTGLAAVGGAIQLKPFANGFLLPLAVSPLLAIAVAALLYQALHRLRLRLGITTESCVCLGESMQPARAVHPGSEAIVRTSAAALPLVLSAGESTECERRYAGAFIGVDAQTAADAVHFVSAGVVGFARGLNDTPKIAALLLAARALDMGPAATAVALAMALGGLLSAKRVADTMSRRITPLGHGDGLAANLSTGFLVILATAYGLPVSTTHVSVGSIFGIGLTRGTANLRVTAGIAFSWTLRVPWAARTGAVVYRLIARAGLTRPKHGSGLEAGGSRPPHSSGFEAG
jgi:PiT family inorganic phosphate transporter